MVNGVIALCNIGYRYELPLVLQVVFSLAECLDFATWVAVSCGT